MSSSSESQLYVADFNLLEKYLIQKAEKYFTRQQKWASDWNNSTIINENDLDSLSSVLGLGLLGDANLDGVVNIMDIIELISTINSGEISDIDLMLQDLNEDGVVNVVDIIELVNQIVEGQS